MLNESFGSNFFPDVTSRTSSKQFNEAAVRAGVTVTVSSGDAGSTNTIGSPATDPLVISVGGSTTFRFYAQTNYARRALLRDDRLAERQHHLAQLRRVTARPARPLDLVAPGDLGFASCDASATFTGLHELPEQAVRVEESGGTSHGLAPDRGRGGARHPGVSQDAPRAPRRRRPWSSRSSSARRRTSGAPATEQGSGLVNSYKAVLLAQPINGGMRATSAAKQPRAAAPAVSHC